MKKITILSFFIILLTQNVLAQNNYAEITKTRAVWLTTNFRLDWPKTISHDDQKEELEKIFKDLSVKKFNTVFFQVRSNGKVLFHSSFENYPDYFVSDTTGLFDPLNFAIKLARKYGMQIHAWVNVFRCLTRADKLNLTDSSHIALKHPEWILKTENKSKSASLWLNPANLNARAYLLDLFTELTEKYNFDALHLDFNRYPNEKILDTDIYKKSLSKLSLEDWRRKNISDFLNLLKIRIKIVGKETPIGVTPFGIYKNLENAKGTQAFYDVYQNVEEWVDSGYVDYIVPQVYWDIKNNPKFEDLVKHWKEIVKKKKLIIGLAAYKEEVMKELDEQIAVANKFNTNGIAIFRYKMIEDKNKEIFSKITIPENYFDLKEYDKIKCKAVLSADIDTTDYINFKWQVNDSLKRKIRGLYLVEIDSTANSKKIRILTRVNFFADSVKMQIRKPSLKEYSFGLFAVDTNWVPIDLQSRIVKFRSKKIGRFFPQIASTFPLMITENDSTKIIYLNSKYDDELKIFIEPNSKTEIMQLKLHRGENIFRIGLPKGIKQIYLLLNKLKKKYSLVF